MSKIISSRLLPVRSSRLVNSMASTGQASSHIPQKMQRSSSIEKLSGYFSRSGQGLSVATMSMQWAGQAVAQRKQATHFTRP